MKGYRRAYARRVTLACVSGHAWVAVVSLAGGVLVTFMVGGGETAAPKIVLAVALAAVVGLAVVALARMRRPAKRPPSQRSIALPERNTQDDVDFIQGIRLTLGERALPWIRTERFETPWRDESVKPFRSLARLLENRSSVTDLQLDVAVEHLADVTHLYLTAYDDCVVTDPLFREDAWKLTRQATLTADDSRRPGSGSEPGSVSELGSTEAARLRELATRVVEAYGHFKAASDRILAAAASERHART